MRTSSAWTNSLKKDFDVPPTRRRNALAQRITQVARRLERSKVPETTGKAPTQSPVTSSYWYCSLDSFCLPPPEPAAFPFLPMDDFALSSKSLSASLRTSAKSKASVSWDRKPCFFLQNGSQSASFAACNRQLARPVSYLGGSG